MDGGPHRYDLRIPTGAVLILTLVAAVFVAYVWFGGLSSALDGEPVSGFAFLDLALVVFGAFSLVGLPAAFIKLWRQRLLDPSVELDPMGIVASGLSFSGDTKRIAYSDIQEIRQRKTSGVRNLTILSTTGERIGLRDTLFSSKKAFEAFVQELERRSEGAEEPHRDAGRVSLRN